MTCLGACQAIQNDWSQQDLQGVPAIYSPRSAVGTSARELLRRENFRKVLVEIQAVEGFAPSQEAINQLIHFLEHTLDRKPGDINLVVSDPIPVAAVAQYATYSVADVRKIEASFRRHLTRKGQLTVYYLFLNRPTVDDQENSKILGQAYANTSIAIYEKTIRDLIQAKPNASLWKTEATIMAHELGHVLGLVNLPSGSHRNEKEDPAQPTHCKNPQCLMHFSAEQSIAEGFSQGIPELKEECLAELQAILAGRAETPERSATTRRSP